MTPEDTKELEDNKAIKFYRRAKWYAHAKGCDLETELDFAAFALIKYLESGRHNIKWSFVDYCRKVIGREGSSRSVGNQEIRAAVDFDSLPDYLWAKDPVYRIDLRVLEKIKDGNLLVLREVYGYEDQEIGDMLGVTNSRICQRRKIAEKSIKRKLQRG